MLSQHQPDIQENGRLFSYVIIYLANLFFVALWIIVIGAPTFRSAWELLHPEVVTNYTAVAKAAVNGCRHLKNSLPLPAR
jgi:hypothetical protein